MHYHVPMTFLLRALALLCVWGACQAAAAETISLGAEDAWYPYSGQINGEARGFTVDLVRAAFAAVGVDVSFQSLPYARCMRKTKEGSLLGCFDTSRSAIVEADYLWHKKPMFNARILIYARADHTGPNTMSVLDLEGKPVIVTHGYEYGDAFDSNKNMLRQSAPTDLSGMRMLLAHRGDYVLVFERVAHQLIKEHPGEFAGKIVPVGVLSELRLYTVFSKTFPNSARYLELFDQGFAIIGKNGRLHEIERQWN